MQLVIVESPAKAKTIEKYLGSGFKVLASYGHIRDLPPKDGSVDPDNGFAMLWDNYADKAKQLSDHRRGEEGRRPHPRDRPGPGGRGDQLACARSAGQEKSIAEERSTRHF